MKTIVMAILCVCATSMADQFELVPTGGILKTQTTQPKNENTKSGPPTNTIPLSFEKLEKAWEEGLDVDAAFLEGRWALTLALSGPQCVGTIDYMYDPNGIKNSDGSIIGLHFEYALDPITETESIFSVMLENLGSARHKQGPYEVDTKLPQFSQYVYYGGTPQSEETYFEYSCRETKAASKLICALRLVSTYSSDAACAKEEAAVIFLYTKTN